MKKSSIVKFKFDERSLMDLENMANQIKDEPTPEEIIRMMADITAETIFKTIHEKRDEKLARKHLGLLTLDQLQDLEMTCHRIKKLCQDAINDLMM